MEPGTVWLGSTPVRALQLQPCPPTLRSTVAVVSSLPASPPAPAFLCLSGPTVTSQKSTSDLIILTLRTCYLFCYNKVQIPQPHTCSPSGFGPSPSLQPRPHPSRFSNSSSSSHPKLHEQFDPMAQRQVWSQPGWSSCPSGRASFSLSVLICKTGMIIAPTL